MQRGMWCRKPINLILLTIWPVSYTHLFQKTDFINLCKSMTELNFKHELKKISCSVLVVCGDKDKINKKASLELQQQIQNSEIVIIENAGHEVNTDNPTLLGQKLNVFFKQYV